MKKLFNHLGAALIASAFLFSPTLVPASWLFDVWSLRYEDGTVYQGRSLLSAVEANYQAQVIDINERMVCGLGRTETSGFGVWTYHKKDYDDKVEKQMDLGVWVADPECEELLVGGEHYKLKASWTFGFFIWKWTAEKQSEFFKFKIVPEDKKQTTHTKGYHENERVV